MFKTSIFLPAITGLLVAYFTFNPLIKLYEKVDQEILKRVPGLDNIPAEGRKSFAKVNIGEFFQSFSATFTSELTGSWPSFRGIDSKNISQENLRLLDEFPPQGPPVLWRKQLGEGHAAFAIFKGRAFILDYLEEENADALRCFSLLDGEELWRRYYKVEIKRNHGYSRTVPAVNASYTVTLGPLCHLMCVDTDSGDLIWTLDLIEAFEGSVPQWYSGQCPLLEDDVVVVAPGGKHTLIAGIDAATGKILWETSNPGGWKMSHSSVVPMKLNGREMYVYAAIGGTVGIAANKENAGEILWQVGDWGATVIAPSPVILSDGFVFKSAGYGAGSVLIKVSSVDKGFAAEIIKAYNPRQALATEQQSAIYYNDLLFGILTKDAGTKRMRLVACEPEDPGNFIFEGNSELRFGLGPMLIADNKFFALADDGSLSLLKFADNNFKKVSEIDILPGVDAWGPLAIADGIMLLRDSTSMVCIDLTKDSRWAKRIKKNADS